MGAHLERLLTQGGTVRMHVHGTGPTGQPIVMRLGSVRMHGFPGGLPDRGGWQRDEHGAWQLSTPPVAVSEPLLVRISWPDGAGRTATYDSTAHVEAFRGAGGGYAFAWQPAIDRGLPRWSMTVDETQGGVERYELQGEQHGVAFTLEVTLGLFIVAIDELRVESDVIARLRALGIGG